MRHTCNTCKKKFHPYARWAWVKHGGRRISAVCLCRHCNQPVCKSCRVEGPDPKRSSVQPPRLSAYCSKRCQLIVKGLRELKQA